MNHPVLPNLVKESEFQKKMLNGVSRTFALTIPQLPGKLKFVVSNAYLLCRIIDTIEDEPTLNYEQKEAYCHQFINVVFDGGDPDRFAEKLAPLLSAQTIPEEHELIVNTRRVIEITRRFSENQQKAIKRCLTIMTEGMLYYQKNLPTTGLLNLKELNRYCYYVAGVVGELLTDLFCDHSPDIAPYHQRMMKLANSFGLGLQLTNILKDIWEDFHKGICWLPRDIFASSLFDLDDMEAGQSDKGFEAGLKRLIGITCRQLEKAVDYTVLIPSKETGIRKFCFWNIGMAALTLKKIKRNPGFTSGNEVKISRNSVKFVALASSVNIINSKGLKTLFNVISFGLPREEVKLTGIPQ